MNVAGGVVLCIGDECSTTFQACTFEHCAVIVAGAAYATLVDSTCRGSAVATYARGAETRLTLECSDFRDCELAACAGTQACILYILVFFVNVEQKRAFREAL